MHFRRIDPAPNLISVPRSTAWTLLEPPMRLLLTILATVILTACSAAPSPDLSMRPGYQGHGNYVPTEEERAYDCKSLAFVVNKSVQQINAMPALAG